MTKYYKFVDDSWGEDKCLYIVSNGALYCISKGKRRKQYVFKPGEGIANRRYIEITRDEAFLKMI